MFIAECGGAHPGLIQACAEILSYMERISELERLSAASGGIVSLGYVRGLDR
jgi:hypothetical protein